MEIYLLLAIIIWFGIASITGAPYVPILGQDRRKLLDLADLKPGQIIIDLGSGDGRLLRAAAQRGLTGIGYEINPIMVIISWIVCWPYRKYITIYWRDIWHTRLPPADIIYVFLIDRYMKQLDQKLQSEITKPTRVVSYVFKLPRQAIRTNKTAAVYQYGPTDIKLK